MLAPEKARLQREWLAAHPDRTPADFDRRVWPLLKENLLEDRARAEQEVLRDRLRASGAYSL